jgi:beta-glucosidase
MFTSGHVPQARLDDIVRRTLFVMFDSGVFDDPLGPPAADASTPAHVDLGTRVAADGTVLLRNERGTLPLAGPRAPRSLAVIGPSGEDAIYVNGGSAGVPPAPGQAVTPLAGIRARAGSGVRVTAAQGSLGDQPLPAIVPSGVLRPASGDGDGPGLSGEYWNNGELAGPPALTRVDPTVDLSAAPAGIGPQLWSARWTGTLTPTESGLHRFALHTGGIAKLFIDDRLVASGYREGTQFLVGPRYSVHAKADLTAGTPVSIRIEYTSKAHLFGAQVHFAWQPPSASGIAGAVEGHAAPTRRWCSPTPPRGEGMDRDTLALPGDQDALIAAVAAANPRTIVVLNTGSPVLMPWLDRVGAVVQSWYPGRQFGAALAAVLFGDTDPGGRLPVTFPASDEQRPVSRRASSRGTRRCGSGPGAVRRRRSGSRRPPTCPCTTRAPAGSSCRTAVTRCGSAARHATSTSAPASTWAGGATG